MITAGIASSTMPVGLQHGVAAPSKLYDVNSNTEYWKATSSGFSVTPVRGDIEVTVTLVGGGGAGGTPYYYDAAAGGGGGAGGVVIGTVTLLEGQSYSLSIGSGGPAYYDGATQNASGSSSTFSGTSVSITAAGGGNGGGLIWSPSVSAYQASSGGSGGGAGGYNGPNGASIPSGSSVSALSPNIGNSGGAISYSRYAGGGGGGGYQTPGESPHIQSGSYASYGGFGGDGGDIMGWEFAGGGGGGSNSAYSVLTYEGDNAAFGAGTGAMIISSTNYYLSYSGGYATGSGGGGGAVSNQILTWGSKGGSGLLVLSWNYTQKRS